MKGSVIVVDSRNQEEEWYPTLNEALRAAMSGKDCDVYLHDDKCESDMRILGANCPCRPVLVQKAK